MNMVVSGKLLLPDEEVNIHVEGEYNAYQLGPAEAYNKAKETIIAAEEKRREKINSEKEDKD